MIIEQKDLNNIKQNMNTLRKKANYFKNKACNDNKKMTRARSCFYYMK